MTLSPDTPFAGDADRSPTRAWRPFHIQPAPGNLPSRELGAAMHTALLAVDITGFGDLHRTEEAHLYLRKAMYEHLIEAFNLGQIPWWDCHREDRGDGALIVAPPDLDPAAFMDPLAHHMRALLRRYHRLAGPASRLQLRMAAHTGRVHRDTHGVTGHATIHLFRLLEAPAFKRRLVASGSDLGLIVSDHLYRDTTRHGGLVNPNAYHPIRITHKQTRRTPAWIWLSTTTPSSTAESR